jgi:hypothetical protein
MGFRTRERLESEVVDGGWLVLDPDQGRVLHLRGSEAEAFTLARTGTRDVPDHLTTSMAGLVELGLVETDAWSRRQVLRFGGAVAAAGIAAVALPSVSAAGSPPGSTNPDTTPPATTTPVL